MPKPRISTCRWNKKPSFRWLKTLTAEDWEEIAAVFAGKDDPRFGPKPEHEFRDLFSRIVNLAPPPIGVGPAR
jgi:hypothetical protein